MRRTGRSDFTREYGTKMLVGSPVSPISKTSFFMHRNSSYSSFETWEGGYFFGVVDCKAIVG